MVDYNLSGLPLGHAGEFPLEAQQQLTTSFTLQATVGGAGGVGLLVGQATANMSGTVAPVVGTGDGNGLVTGTPNLAVQGGVILAALITGDEAFLAPYGLLEDSFLSSLGDSSWTPFPVFAEAQVTGGFIIGAFIGGDATERLLSAAASANMTGGLSFEQFIGEGDSVGNGLLSAAATANMTGALDGLRDGGSPPFVIFNGTDQYLSHPVASDSDLRGGANFSCVVVFDPELVEQGQSGVICGKHDPGSTEWGWRVYWNDSTGEITVTVSSAADGSNRAERTTAVGSPGMRVRTVFVFTWDSTSLELYVAGSSSQGAQTDTGTPGAMVQGGALFAIGADNIGSTPANFFQGAVHAVYIFDDVLSSGEVATIDQSGYIPPALDDVNFVVAWQPSDIGGQTTGFVLKKWLDSLSYRTLDRSSSSIVCFPGALDQLRFVSDDWNMDFANSEIVGVSLDQDLASNYTLSTSTTNFVESGGFRLFTPVTAENEPEIVTGFRTYKNDITVVWGGRHDDQSSTDVVWFEMLGLQVFLDAGTLDLYVFQGDTGTTTRYEFGQSIPGMETGVPDGPGVVFALRYNSQTDQFTLFVNGVKLFEEGTTVTGSAITNTGLRFCSAADWAAINSSASQADRRAAKVIPSCLPDIFIEQLLQGLTLDVYGMDNAAPIGRTLRAALRRNPVPELPFGLSFFEYDALDAADDDPPTPFPALRRAYPSGSGTIEIEGQPLDGEQVEISDGTTTLIFEIEVSGGITGDVSVPLGGSVTQTLANFQTAINGSALDLTASAPVVFEPDGLNSVGYIRLVQDNLNDGDLPLSRVLTAHTIAGGRLRATGPYKVLGPVGSLELYGQPTSGDRFTVDDGTNPPVGFIFGTNVTIGATIVDTMDNLVTAVNAAALDLTANPTVSFTDYDYINDSNTNRAYTVLRHARSDDPDDYPNRVGLPVTVPVNVSGNLVSSGVAQPTPFAEAVPTLGIPVHGFADDALSLGYTDSPYDVLEVEDDDDGGTTLPPFINPNPTISSVTADIAKNVTAVANAGPTDAGDVRSWWEIELVADDPQFNLRIDEQDNSFAINKNQIDQWPVPTGQNWEDLRIRFVIHSQLDPDQIWYSLYLRMDGENFDNGETETIILPGTGAPEPPPTIELEIALEEQAFTVEEAEAAAFRQLELSNRSRYKLTSVFTNSELDPRIEGRNEDGLEFGLLSVLDDFLELGTEVRTYTVSAGDIGFLDRIAVRFYGAGFEDFWWAVAYANGIADPDAEMFVGQKIIIPPREAVTAFLSRKSTGGI